MIIPAIGHDRHVYYSIHAHTTYVTLNDAVLAHRPFSTN
jgi:hypothetical protein